MHVAIHTIPVPEGMSAEQAWACIDGEAWFDGDGIQRPCGWANALVIDDSYKGILPADQDEAEAMIDRAKAEHGA